MSSDSEELTELLTRSLLGGVLRKAVFSKPAKKQSNLSPRIDIRPVQVAGQVRFQLTTRRENQDHHANLTAEEAIEELGPLAGHAYLDIMLQTSTEEVTARHSRKGVCRLTRRPLTLEPSAAPAEPHNRRREYLIPDTEPVPFLVATGVMTADGRVKDQQRKKFRQINRYAEFVKEVASQLDPDQILSIVDFGCGKSYLTFATHYVLTRILNRRVSIVGLDRRQDVIDTCTRITNNLQLQDIRFETGDIAGFQPDSHVHIAISLHACDTATDDALAMAASWKADVILAVPCCQHELAAELSPKQEPVFSKHGILHERFSSLATDALRAHLMECASYKTQVLEFIDTEHTPKNLLIRSIRRPDSVSEPPDPQYSQNIRRFSQQFALPPLRLQQKLEEYGLLPSMPTTEN